MVGGNQDSHLHDLLIAKGKITFLYFCYFHENQVADAQMVEGWIQLSNNITEIPTEENLTKLKKESFHFRMQLILIQKVASKHFYPSS